MQLLLILGAILAVLAALGIGAGWIKLEVRVPITTPGGGRVNLPLFSNDDDDNNGNGSIGGLVILAGVALFAWTMFRGGK